MRAPEFWHRRSTKARILAPLGALYGFGTAARLRLARPWRAPVPVICVGNLVAGGAGKTPVAKAFAERLAAAGREPHFVTRGHGGRESGPLRVDPRAHAAADVGDEALLLARCAPCWVARDRAAGARAAVAAGAGVVVLDDGFQNGALVKDIAVVVIDGGYGFGNGLMIPAGPLREPPQAGLARADAVVVVGDDETGAANRGPAPRAVLRVDYAADKAAARELAGRRAVAFAGIGRPEKFFRTLRGVGCHVVATRAFPDHYLYRPGDIEALAALAAKNDALLVTTEKDSVRLPAEAHGKVRVLPIRAEWRDRARLDRLLAPVIGNG